MAWVKHVCLILRRLTSGIEFILFTYFTDVLYVRMDKGSGGMSKNMS